MSLTLSIIKTVGGPGSAGFFFVIVAMLLLAGWNWPRLRRWVTTAIAVVAAGYLLLAVPLVANGIIDDLSPVVAVPNPGAVHRVRVLVVFDGDNREGRLRSVQDILARAAPREAHLLGGDYLLADLRAVLEGTTVLHYDASTRDTAAQVRRIREIAGQWPPMTTAVVASRVQAPRIVALLDRARTTVLVVPSPLDHEPAASGISALVPALGALQASRDAIYEHVALWYYRSRGDIR